MPRRQWINGVTVITADDMNRFEDGLEASEAPINSKESHMSQKDVEIILGAYCPFRVGVIIQLAITENPAVMYPGTEWQRITDAFLWSSDTPSTRGGSKTISVENLPEHTHEATQAEHVHTQPQHSHNIGTYKGYNVSNGPQPGNAYGDRNTPMTIVADPAGGENTGSAAPVITISNTGSGVDYMPLYYSVCTWLRIK